MAIKLSKRSGIESFRALDNLRIANEKVAMGEDLVRLEAGQPCFGVPEAVLKYSQQVLSNDPRQGYTEALGMKLLRDRIAVYYRDTYGHDLDYTRIAITAGSSAAFIMAFLAAFDAGDTIALCTPTYAAYKNILGALDLKIVEIQTDAETNFQPSAALLEKAFKKVRFNGIIINSPSNPTGTLLDEAEFQKIADWCEDHDVRLISDEAYHGITYEKKAQTALKFSKSAIVLNTFSKYFAMTGWRLGWVVTPEDMTGRIKNLTESLLVAPPTISQHAAYKIFDHLDVLDGYVAHYRRNRDILKDQLPKIGLDKLSAGDGAFYLYADVSDYTTDSEALCRAMLEEAKVSVTAGIDFDPSRGRQFIRMSYAGSAEDMQESCRRLEKFLSVQNARPARAKAV